MNGFARQGILAAWALVLGGAVCGCSQRSGPTPKLDGMVFAIPVYAGTQVVARSPFDLAVGGSSFDAVKWDLVTTDPLPRIVSFYLAQLQTSASEDNEECLVFRYAPPGAEDGELVEITIFKTREENTTGISIAEVVRAGKRMTRRA